MSCRAVPEAANGFFAEYVQVPAKDANCLPVESYIVKVEPYGTVYSIVPLIVNEYERLGVFDLFSSTVDVTTVVVSFVISLLFYMTCCSSLLSRS
jgi:hypothetical protein